MNLTCRVCHKPFHNDLAVHNHGIHKCKTCINCDYTFNDGKEIRSHMRAEHLPYKCTTCKRDFFLATSCEDHSRMKHGVYERAMPHGNETSFDSELRLRGGFSGLVKDIQPNPEKMKRCKEVVEKLKLFMQHNTKYNINKFVKGGSMRKGTSVKDSFDLDLVVFINDYTSVTELGENMTGILSDLEDHIVGGHITWAKGVSFKKKSHRSVQFTITGHEDEDLIEVDLLPAVDLGIGPRKNIFREMQQSPETRPLYSPCLTQDQVDFVDDKPQQVKDLIRLVKYWKEIEAVKIRSYCVELIVIGLWQKWGRPKTFDMEEKFKKVMEKLTCLGSMKMYSLGKYPVSDYTTLPAPPAVIDPANPFVNVADNIKPSDFQYIEGKAKETLAKI